MEEIYPEIHIENIGERVSFDTYAIKEHDGKQYECHFHKEIRRRNDEIEAKALKQFRAEIDEFIMSGVIDLTMIDYNGKPVYELVDEEIEEQSDDERQEEDAIDREIDYRRKGE